MSCCRFLRLADMEEFLQDAERLAAAEEGGEDEDAAGLLGAGQLLHVPFAIYWFCKKPVEVLTWRKKGGARMHALLTLADTSP